MRSGRSGERAGRGADRRRGRTSPALAEAWAKFYEEAGKDTAAQRLRASLVVGFLVEAVRQALRLSLGADVPGLDPAEEARLRAFAERLGPDRLLELIDKCVEADYHVERRVQLILVVESVLEQFTKPAAVQRASPGCAGWRPR